MNIFKFAHLFLIIIFTSCASQSTLMYTPNTSDGDERLLSVEPAKYPENLYKSRLEGFVTVKFSIDTNGTVIDAEVVEEVPEGYFAEAALESVYTSKYRPRIVDGEPVMVTNKIRRVTFNVSGRSGSSMPSILRTCRNSTQEQNKNKECRRIE